MIVGDRVAIAVPESVIAAFNAAAEHVATMAAGLSVAIEHFVASLAQVSTVVTSVAAFLSRIVRRVTAAIRPPRVTPWLVPTGGRLPSVPPLLPKLLFPPSIRVLRDAVQPHAPSYPHLLPIQ